MRGGNLLLALSVLSITFGCSNGPKLGEVSGTVTYDGEPLHKATVTFTHADGQTAFARTDEKGHYELQFSDGRGGAKLGENAVAIETARVGTDEQGEIVEFPEILPAKFHVDSELSATIEEGKQTLDFSLEK